MLLIKLILHKVNGNSQIIACLGKMFIIIKFEFAPPLLIMLLTGF